MKSILKYGILTCLLGMMLSCADELIGPDVKYDVSITVEDGIAIELAFPDMPTVSTRVMGSDIPNLMDLDIFLFVFDGSTLKQTIHIPAGQTAWAKDANGQELHNRIAFRANLPQTDNDAIIHIVALKDDDHSFVQQINQVGYGLEDVIMPKFAVSGTQDAYWQRVVLDCPIIVSVDNNEDEGLEDVEGTETEVAEQLKLVKLVRNFAKITMTLSDELTQKNTFKLLGWTVVNDLDGGSVTPWYSPIGVADILYPKYILDDGRIANYDDMVNQGYPGVSYAGAKFRHTLTEVSANGAGQNTSIWNTDPKYLYDRKVVSVNPLYILIYGTYQGVAGYYKISLAHRDSKTGLVSEYNVLRNIEYKIVINDVTAPGYDTPADAAAGPAFNNVSGDVTTRNMLQISDGVDMLFVNFVKYVVTQEDQEIIFMYRYLENIQQQNGTLNNDKVIWSATQDVPDNAGVGLIVDPAGLSAVVTEVEGPETTTDPRTNLEWKMLKLKFIAPTDELREQKFTIYTPPKIYNDQTSSVGLSRTINLVVRNPWDYERVRIYPQLYNGENDDEQFPTWTPGENDMYDGNILVGNAVGAGLTLFFELPAGLPESMFPLDFVIESDRQNIENAGQGNAVVQNGESLFKDQGVNDLRIQYVKTVMWSDYAPNGESSTAASRVIRARFVTTTAMNSYPSNVSSIVTTVRLHNPAFNDADYQFVRKK